MSRELLTLLRIAVETTGADRVQRLNTTLQDMGLAADRAEGFAQKLDQELDDLRNSAGRTEAATQKLDQGLDELGASADRAAEKTREAGRAAQSTGSQAQAGAGGVSLFAQAIQALAAGAVAREFLQANASLESLLKSLEAVTGDSTAAGQELAFVREQANRLGLEVQSAAASYTNLLASSKGTRLEGQASREIWTAVAESMARLGKSTEDTDAALLAVGQMMSKGVVSAEELRGQLGERLPGAFQAAARAINTTTQGLGEMLERGEILAEDFLPKFAAELQKTGGGEVDSFNANLNRLKNTITDVFVEAGQTGAFDALSQGLKYVAVATVTAWEGFELLGKALGNLAYSLTSLDFSGYQKRQQESLAAAQADVARVIEKLFPLQTGLTQAGEAGRSAGQAIAAGQRQGQAALQQTTAEADNLARSLEQQVVNALRAAEKASEADARAKTSAIGVSVEEQKTILALAQAKGDESTARQAAIKIAELEAAQARINAEQAVLLAKSNLKEAETKLRRAQASGANVVAMLDEVRAARLLVTEQENNAAALEEQIKRRQQLLADAQTQALVALDTQANTSIQSFQNLMAVQQGGVLQLNGQLSDVLAHSNAVGAGLAAVINQTRQAVGEATGYAARAMADLQQAVTSNKGTISDYLANLEAVKTRILDLHAVQSATVAGLVADLETGAQRAQVVGGEVERSIQATIAQAEQAAGALEYLGGEQLEPLRRAIDDARQRLMDLRQQAGDTLATVRDEYDQLMGNLDELEQRRQAARLAEIQAQLDAAQAAGATDAVAELQQALRLQQEIAAARVAQARADEQARQAREAASPAAPTGNGTPASQATQPTGPAQAGGSTAHTLTINLPGVASGTVNLATAADANLLEALLSQLEAAMSRSARR